MKFINNNKLLKVLHILPEGFGNGGIQNVVMNISRNLSKENYEFSGLKFTEEIRFHEKEFISFGGKVYTISLKRFFSNNNFFIKNIKRFIRYFFIKVFIYYRVKKLFKRERFDIVHCHNIYYSGIIMRAAYDSKINSRIVHNHITVKRYGLINKYFIKKYSTKILAVSKMSMNSLFNKKNKFNNVEIVNNPIDLYKFNNSKCKKKETDVLSILHVGSFSDNKNQLFLLKIVSILSKKIKVRLFFVGFNDQYKELLLNMVNAYKLENTVLFLKHDSNIPNLLALSDIFVFPSKHEGFGLALIEAQAMGVFCFASDSIPKETDLGLVRYLSLELGAEKWAEVIKNHILNNEDKNYKISEEKLQEFDIRNVIIKYRKIYNGEIL